MIQGFRLAAGTFGCDVDVLDCGTKSGEDSSERTRGYLARNLNRLRKYSAIFVGSSMTAVAAMSFLAEHGIAVPEEISMLALGDVKIAGAERLSVAASAAPISPGGAGYGFGYRQPQVRPEFSGRNFAADH